MNPSRPNFSPAYGISQETKRLLPWSHAIDRLTASRNYWLATTRPDGRPHVAPVWGAWVDGALYFGTDRTSVKARNLEANPTLVVHLESGDDVVILEGIPEIIPDPAAVTGLDAAYRAKYDMGVAEAGETPRRSLRSGTSSGPKPRRAGSNPTSSTPPPAGAGDGDSRRC